MGAEVSSTSKDYTFGNVETLDSKNQSFCQASRKNGEVFTAFCWNKLKAKDGNIFASNATKHLKVIRHPGILKYFDCISNDKQIYLLTEKVTPLSKNLEDLDILEVLTGIHDIIEAITFLHEKCNLSHNSICLNSIFVTCGGRWKLAGMQHICSYEVLKTKFSVQIKDKDNEILACPEDKVKDFKTKQYFGHERDAFGVANLISELKDRFPMNEDMANCFTDTLNLYLDPDPSKRPIIKELLNGALLKNDYLLIRNFLDHVTLKSADEKEEFFKTVAEKLYKMPERFVASKLSHLLLSRLVLLDKTANNHLLPRLLKPGQSKLSKRNLVSTEGEINPIFTASCFKKFIIPRLTIMLTVRDAAIRLVLLRYFGQFVRLIPKDSLQHEILPKLAVGLKDTDDVLVSATLRAIADVVPILGGEIVIGGPRSKLFTTSLPKDESCGSVGRQNLSKGTLSESLEREKNDALTQDAVKDSKDFKDVKDNVPLADDAPETKNDSTSEILEAPPPGTTTCNIPVPPNQEWLKMESIPERSSPDGGEDPKIELYVGNTDNIGDEWSDWGGIESDNEERCFSSTESISNCEETVCDQTKSTLLSMSEGAEVPSEKPADRLKTLTLNQHAMKLEEKSPEPVPEAPKLMESVFKRSNKVVVNNEFQDLNIFASLNFPKKDDELDLFKDMQPNITKTPSAHSTFLCMESKEIFAPENVESKEKSVFAMSTESNDQIESGWGDDLEWDALP